MPTNTETLNRQLYQLLSKYKPKPLDATGKATPVPDEADIFKFEFTKDGEEYGTVFVTLDDDRVLTVYFGDDVSNSPGDKTPGLDYDDSWSGFLHQLSSFRMTRGLKGFNTKNKDHVNDDMARRKHMRDKDKIAEGYYPMGRKASYSDAIPTVKIVIEHSRVIEEGEQRYRNINRIFLENQEGERYLLDTKKPGIARVYARHIAEGGKVNDDRWNHVHSLCEEYSKMAGFVRATRNGQFNESAQSLVNEGIAHYQSLRESLSRMTGKRGYNAYFESWTPALMETEGDESNLNELFVQETLDPRIESVMPILNRIHKKVSESVVDKEMNKLAEWADSLVEEESLTSNNPVGIPESLDQYSPVTQAITRRILMQHPDLLQKYGPEKVGDAIDSVAEYVGDVEEIGGSDVSGWVKQVTQSLNGIAEGKGDFGKAIENLHGWYEVDPDEPNTRQFDFDDDEDGYDASGTVIQDLKTGKIKVDFNVNNGYYGTDDIHSTFDSIGDAMNALGNITTQRRYNSGKKPNYDTLALKKSAGPDDVYKTDKAGKKGTLTKGRMGDMKASSQYTMRGGPKGVLPEEEVEESALQAYLGNKKYGEKGMDALRKAGREHAGKEKMQNIRAKFSHKEEGVSEEVDMGQYDARKSTKGDTSKEQEKSFREKVQKYGKELEQRQKEKEVDEGLDANQKRVGQLGPTEKVGPKGAVGKLVGANESQLDEISQELAVKTLGKRRAHGMDGWGDDEAHRKADATEKRVEKKFGKDAVAAADKITDKELYGDRKMKENFINMDAQAVTTEDEMDEGTHTQYDRDLNPNDYERSNTDWSRDPIEAGSDRIHQKISSILKRLEKPKSPQHDKRDTDIGSVLEEMDKSQPSAYTGRDTDPRPGPDKEAKPISKEKMVKHALDTLTKSMAKKDDKKDVKEGQDDLDRILQIMNHRR